jgi:hypothetical protein
MNNKQLAEMIKTLREKKLEEIVGKPGPFNPAHKSTHKEDPTSPNQHFHEEKVDENIRMARGNRLGKGTLGNLPERSKVHKQQGSQSSRFRYLNQNSKLEEDDKIKLGKTDTGQNGEEIKTNPPDTTFSARSSTNQNTNTKEIKEKKNATMG